MDDVRTQLLKLLKDKAYFEEKITLSSGKESDYYIDARRVTLSAAGAYLCGQAVLEKIEGLSPDAVGGPTLGADPLVGAIGALSHKAGHPVDTFIIRKSPKAHGKQQQVEGPLLKIGGKVVLIDDVATTGKAFLQSLDVLDAMKIDVIKAVCLVDRGEGAAEALAERGCMLDPIFTIKDFR